ncbi:hypothetical protein LguiA_004498 [Lonicera macranthoides]
MPFIQKIVRVVENKVGRKVLHIGRHLVGLHPRAKNINLWVQDSSTDVKILMCGMGGIGKTTIAKFVYNLNYQAFECTAFIAPIREKSEQPSGLVHLQEHLLSNILKRKKKDMFNVDESIIAIEQAIYCKRVLLVLDDVSKAKQLDALLGTQEFYPGSKIIITTRHKWLLKAHRDHKMYIVEKLGDSDSMELFCWHAFGQNHPVDGYEELSNRVVYCCGGIPLAHEILGSSLLGKSIDVWISTLEKLEAIPDAQIIRQLKLSYESLQDEHDKNLFLYIACFFVGNEISDTVTILDGCSFFARVGIESLIDRCLITIEKDNKMMMHQLIKEMGRQIVDQKSPQELGRRSRLWRHKDSFIVLKEKKVLGSLKILNISHSLQLTRTLEFFGLPNLEKLILKGCVGLIEVCESIGSLKGLTVLNLEDCKNLRKFSNIGKLKFLETLIIAGCSNMTEFLADLKNVESLKVFQADKVAINHLLPNTSRGFKLWDAFSRPWLPKPCKSVEGFWASLPHSLVNLSLVECNLSNDSFPTDLCNLVSLQELNLSGNPLRSVPDCINRLRRLKILLLARCRRLQYVRVTNVEQLSRVESTLVKRIICNQPYLEKRPIHSFTRFINLLKHEGVFKLEHLVKVEREMLNNLGLFNLELIRNLVVRLAFPLSYCRDPESQGYQTKDLPIQGLNEFGIFNTFLPKTEAPSWCNELNRGSSISFIVPSYPNLWIRGLNVCGVYALSKRKDTWFPFPIFTRISNKTKDLNWMYNPWLHGFPVEDGEELAWISHWKFGNELESGDEIIISMVTDDSFEVKECGFNIVWVDHREEKETSFNMGHNSSPHQVKTGVYLLSHHHFPMDYHNHLTAPRWFRELFGDSIKFEGISSTYSYTYLEWEKKH